MKRWLIIILLFSSNSLMSAQKVIKRCKTCNKPLSECKYKGNHTKADDCNIHPSSSTTDKTKSGIVIQITKEVDLGLPSGTIWSGWNIGASSPSGYGKYYSWGETTTKKTYTFANYFDTVDSSNFSKGYKEYGYEAGKKHTIIGTKRDVATQLWGEQWCMPSDAQWEEIIKVCKVKKDKYKSTSGLIITGPNGKSLFLPASGANEDEENWVRDRNEEGLYWVGNMGNHTFNIEFDLWNHDIKIYWQPREPWEGHTVRAVKNR